jgi:hypothetical protein
MARSNKGENEMKNTTKARYEKIAKEYAESKNRTLVKWRLRKAEAVWADSWLTVTTESQYLTHYDCVVVD